MATTFYIRNLNIGVNSYNLSETTRGNSVTTLTIPTIAGSSAVNGTDFVSGGFWGTRPLIPFTLSGTISVNLRASESNNLANASMRCRIYKWSRLSGLSSILLTLTQAVELTTTNATVTLSGTPTTTIFNAGDILVLEIGITNWGGTMTANNRSVSVTYNGATTNATGDSYITINENVDLKDKLTITT